MKSKKIFKVITVILSIFSSNLAYGNEKIVFLDMNYIMSNSTAGKSITKQIDEMNKKDTNNLKKTEENLLLEEKNLISQKNVLDKSDFEKKIIDLREKINDYKKLRANTKNKSTKIRLNAQSTLLNQLSPILADYSKENAISMIMSKENIIIGKNELNITNDILDLLNKKIKKIEVK